MEIKKTAYKHICYAGYKCDVCKKEVKGPYPDNWHSFYSLQCISQDHLVCSVACYIQELQDFVDLTKNDTSGAKFDDMCFPFAQALLSKLKGE